MQWAYSCCCRQTHTHTYTRTHIHTHTPRTSYKYRHMEVFLAIPLHPLWCLALSVSHTLVILLCAIPHSSEHQSELNKRMEKKFLGCLGNQLPCILRGTSTVIAASCQVMSIFKSPVWRSRVRVTPEIHSRVWAVPTELWLACLLTGWWEANMPGRSEL